MIRHTALGAEGFARSRRLNQLVRAGAVSLAGNRKLKIYGTLPCASGKRMKAENRVFFANETEALHLGYRPCGHCCKAAYSAWKEAGARLRQR